MHRKGTESALPENIGQRLYKKYGEALSSKKYLPAITLFEKYLRQYILPANQKYRLGLLYDHLAMMNEHKIPKESFRAYLHRAEKIYREILKEDPSFFRAFYGIGRVYSIKKDYKNGLRFQIHAYRQMLKLPRKQRGALAIGHTYETIGDYKNAEKWYLKERHDAPRNDFGTTLNLFMFYKNRGERGKALRYALRTEKLLKNEYKKKIYKGLKMYDSQFIKYIKGEIKNVRRRN